MTAQTRLRWFLVCVFVLVGEPALSAALFAGPSEPRGLLIEAESPRFGGDLAGLQVGDWIVSWEGAGATGLFETPFDLWQVIFEQAPRGTITVYGQRAGEDKVWSLPPSRWWGIETRPVLPDDVLALYDEAKKAAQTGDVDRGVVLATRAAEILAGRGDIRRAAWLDRWAAASANAKSWEASDQATERGVERLMARGDLWGAVLLRRWNGLDHQQAGRLEQARQRYRRALDLARHVLTESMQEPKILIGLGASATLLGDLIEADADFREALRATEKIAPENLDRAEVLVDLGEVALERGDLAAADRWMRDALAIQERLAPRSLEIGVNLINLADLAWQRGYLSDAESLNRRALEIYEWTLPGQKDVARVLGVLAKLALSRGNLALAEEYLNRSLELFAGDPAENYGFSEVLATLAGIAVQRGELANAHQYLIRAVQAREQISGDNSGLADTLLSLGRLEVLRGDPAAARALMQRALAIRRRQSARSIHIATILREMGALATASPAAARQGEALLVEAVSIFRDQVPGSLAEAEAELALGHRLAARGALQAALRRFSQAFATRNRLSPGSVQEADALYQIGLVKRRMGKAKEAAHDLCAAVDLLDRQRLMLGGPTETKAYFEATAVPYYEACLRALVENGRPSQAFAVLERGRARAFLALLAERELRPAELPPELAAERWRLGSAYDRLQETLSRLSPGRDSAEIERLQAQLFELRDQQEALAGRIRQASPHAASLHEPQPTDLAGARSVLDPGTVLLSYSVGEKNTLLFIVESNGRPGTGLTVHALPVGREALRKEVERLRSSTQDPGTPVDAFLARAARLYDQLLGPAEPALRAASRVLICPDGPLHALPFAALRRHGKYLAEWKALHFAPSATAYAELRRVLEAPAERPPLSMAAFGGPTYPTGKARGTSEDAEVRSAVRRGLKLSPLPSSRHEAAGVSALFQGGQAFLGDQATEEQVKRIAPQARYLHFACHGLLDERMPLNSGLALSIPEHPAEGQDNGILQAWEIFDTLRLDADLVTLSACDTALGKDMGGEGILGLTRAFQFAGARSVLSSLWSVADESTATLMQSFYVHLQKGESKDEALRAAQLGLVHAQGRKLSHPFYWAAFQLYGAWR